MSYSVRDIANELGIPFWDYTNAPEFQGREYFKESMHLNNVGARLFTDKIIDNVKVIIAK